MARRKRIPYKPDAFQSFAGRVARAVGERARIIIVGIAVAAVLFIIAFALAKMSSTAEHEAWAAYTEAGRDPTKLRAAGEDHGSSSARPYVLFSLARSELKPPEPEMDEEGNPKPERESAREARLERAEEALVTLDREHPDHLMNAYGLALLGLVLEEQGAYDRSSYEEAVEILTRAWHHEKMPGALHAKLRYDIGRNYWLAGRPGPARGHLYEAWRAWRQSPTVRWKSQRNPFTPPREREAEMAWGRGAWYLYALSGGSETTVPFPKMGAPRPKAPESSPGPEKAPFDLSPQGALRGLERAPAEKEGAEKKETARMEAEKKGLEKEEPEKKKPEEEAPAKEPGEEER